MTENKAFEATYPAYPFRVLVEFGLALSRLYLRSRRPHESRDGGAPSGALGAR